MLAGTDGSDARSECRLPWRRRLSTPSLSLDELAAEKVLGWCTKDPAKHFVDLPYLRREYDARLD